MSHKSQLSIAFLVGRDALHPTAAGGDLQAWTWACWLAARGHNVHYVCQSSPGLAATEDIDGVHIARLGDGIMLPLRAWRYVRSQGRRFDLIYEDPIGANRPPYLSPVWSRTPVVAVWHQVSRPLLYEMYPRIAAAALSSIERIVAARYRRCHFWAPSEETAKSVTQAFGFDNSRMHVVYPTTEPSNSLPTQRTSRRNILALGLYRRYKAFDHVIRAMPTILAHSPGAHLTIAGRRSDDDYANELRALAHDLHIAEHVSFRFNLSDQEKRATLDETDLMIVPSRLEGYGIVVIEANDAGIPVVASSGVPRAAVTDGINGLRYEYGDLKTLATQVIRCLTNDQIYAALVSGCRTHAQRRTVDAIGPQFQELIDSALRAESSIPRRTTKKTVPWPADPALPAVVPSIDGHGAAGRADTKQRAEHR